MQAIGNGQLFEVQPEPFNWVEEWTVLGQPDDQNAVFVQTKSRLSCLAMVIRRIIHHQNEMLAGIVHQQTFQEGDEGFAVLVVGSQITDMPSVPVVAAK